VIIKVTVATNKAMLMPTSKAEFNLPEKIKVASERAKNASRNPSKRPKERSRGKLFVENLSTRKLRIWSVSVRGVSLDGIKIPRSALAYG
jgi:hypothetical protein